MVENKMSDRGADRLRKNIEKGLDVPRLSLFHSKEKYLSKKKELSLGNGWLTEKIHVSHKGDSKEIFCTQVESVLGVLHTLVNRLPLVLDPASPRVVLRVGVDSGGGVCKLAISVANVKNKINSAFNWYILGAYTGGDDYVSLRACFPKLFSALNAIQNVIVGDRVVPVQMVLIGDNKSISAVQGHAGQACSYPCFICMKPLSSFQPYGQLLTHVMDPDTKNIVPKVKKQKSHTHRKLDDVKKQGSEAVQMAEDQQKVNLKQTGGMCGVPLLDIPVKYWIMPLMHDTMGPTVGLHANLIADASYADAAIAEGGEENLKLYLFPSQSKEAVFLNKTRLTGSNSSLVSYRVAAEKYSAVVQKAMDSLQQGTDILSPMKSSLALGCAHWWCAERLQKFGRVGNQFTGMWAACDRCHRDVHYVCDGYVCIEQHKQRRLHICLVCREAVTATTGLRGVLNRLDEQRAYVQANLDVRQRLANITQTGLFTQLDLALKQNGVRQEKYYTGTLNGEACSNMLKNMHKILEPLHRHRSPVIRSLAERYQAVANTLRLIQEGTACKVLEKEEKIRLLKACNDLDAKYAQNFPQIKETVKTHTLTKHLKYLLDEFTNLGWLSEQGLEALHAHFNQLRKQLSAAHMSPLVLQRICNETNTRSIIMMTDPSF